MGTYKRSRQRERILELLQSTGRHPTADWVYNELKEEFPNLSMGTVYRNLQILAEEGLVRVIPEPSGRKRYDADTSEHSHIRCIRCGRVGDVATASAAKIRKSTAAKTDFLMLGYRVDFVGLCPGCESQTMKQKDILSALGEYEPLKGGPWGKGIELDK